MASAAWRLTLALASRTPLRIADDPEVWPRYSVLAALYHEAEVAPQLIAHLAQLDYPEDRLEGWLLLEADDSATIAAAQGAARPDWLKILIVPPGSPQTKPRALNHGLARSTGDLVTIYDAEDHPDPMQLREAAARFCDPREARTACLQAPLRIRRLHRSRFDSAFLDRQFAVEYASLFEVTLPAMARLGLPFPLGGTSNHFRSEVLREVGGWDPHNVTEDADLSFRLWRHGWRLGVLRAPTWETPPGRLETWLPQRCRWLKGYMQTLGVHTRSLHRLGLRGGVALVMTVGLGLASAAIHGLSLAWLAATVLVAAVAGLPPAAPIHAIAVLVLGAAAAWTNALIGARRAGVPYGPTDMIMSPAYWSLMSLAFVHAAWRLFIEPHAWDKTPHHRDGPAERQDDGPLDTSEIHLLGEPLDPADHVLINAPLIGTPPSLRETC